MATALQYWCSESLLVTVDGPQGRSTIAVDKPFARIGSHPGSEILLQGTGIDARCLYLHATSEGVFCVRLSATQRLPVGSGTWLRPDEMVQLGPYQISARLQHGKGQSPPRLALTAWGSAAPPLPVCEIFLNGNLRDKRRFRARLNLVGRRREHALQLQGQQVSSCHCALFWESGKLWCIDLLSSNGTQWQDQQIDCVLLEMGQSVHIGEFSLLLKRLSRASLRPSAWRTDESDEDVLGDDVNSVVARPPAGSMAQTISAASGDTGEAPPSPESRQQTTTATAVVRPASQLLEGAHAELQQDQQDQEVLQNEFARRSQLLLTQRQQLDQQLEKSTHQVASQVSHLQNESATIAAQRQEVERLRAECEEQRRILTEDLRYLKEELSHHQVLLNEQKRLVSFPGTNAIASRSELVDRSSESHEELSDAAFRSESEGLVNELAGSSLPRNSLHRTAHQRTVIEGSYVVEKERPSEDTTPRRGSNFSVLPVKPMGRRHALESSLAVPAPAKSDADSIPPAPADADSRESQSLAVVEHVLDVPQDATSSRVAGRRKPAQEDHLGAFVTDRLALREEARRFWLRVLWGLAVVVSLLAVATLGYIVLSAR